MKSKQKIDIVARDLTNEVHDANFIGAKMKAERRMAALERDYEDSDKLRETAGLIKRFLGGIQVIGPAAQRAQAKQHGGHHGTGPVAQRSGHRLRWSRPYAGRHHA